MNRSTILLSVICVSYLFISTSCDDIFAEKKFFLLSEESKEWLVVGDTGDSFIMRDSLGHSQLINFYGDIDAGSSSKSSSGFLGLKDRTVEEYEIFVQHFSSDDGLEFSVRLSALGIPGQSELILGLNDVQLEYDPLNRRIYRVLLWQRIDESSSEGHSLDVNEAMSEVVFLDSLVLNQFIYNEVLDFTFLDFKELWTDSTIVEFAYAKGLGLLRYSLNNGQVFERQSP